MNMTFKLVLSLRLVFVCMEFGRERSSLAAAHDADGPEPLLTSSGVFYHPPRISANQDEDEEGDEDGHDGNELRESGVRRMTSI